MAPDYEVIVIGGGPAGLSAGIWCADLGLRAIILETDPEAGGQLSRVHNAIANYPGGIFANGDELRIRFLDHLLAVGGNVRCNARVTSIDLARKSVSHSGGEEISADNIIIATGVRRRKLNVPGEDEYAGRGILDSGVRSRDEVAGRRVVIVGGGDAAVENAVILSGRASHVTMIHRRERFTGRREFLEEMLSKPNITQMLLSRVVEFCGDEVLQAVKVEDLPDGSLKTLECDNALVRVGSEPNSELVRGQLSTDAEGYILVDQHCRTSRSDVFAIGDIGAPGSPTVSTAAGMAAAAAKYIASKNIRKSEFQSEK